MEKQRRKSPIRHRVKSHTRKNRPVRSYIRGRGVHSLIVKRRKLIQIKLSPLDRKVLIASLDQNMEDAGPYALWSVLGRTPMESWKLLKQKTTDLERRLKKQGVLTLDKQDRKVLLDSLECSMEDAGPTTVWVNVGGKTPETNWRKLKAITENLVKKLRLDDSVNVEDQPKIVTLKKRVLTEEERVRGRHGIYTKTKTIERSGILHWYLGTYPNEQKFQEAIQKRKYFGNFKEVPMNQLSIIRVPVNGKLRLYVGLKKPYVTPIKIIRTPSLSVLRE